MKTPAKPMTAAEFDKLFQEVCNWGRWGEDDERGTMNYLTPRHVAAAARLVRTGQTVSLSVPVNTVEGPDNPHPAVHRMLSWHQTPTPEGEPRFAADRLDSEFHGDCFTHMDCLGHVSYKGKVYNGKPASVVSEKGVSFGDITAYAHGIVGRGVLLDIPRLRGVKWLELGDAVTAEELEAAEKAQGVRMGEGDIMVFRTGHHRRRLELGSWNPAYSGQGMAGLHATAMRMLHERKVAAFFPDGDGETVPSNVEGIAYPVHLLQIVAMGMACADSLQFEELVPICEKERRWEFMVAASPLRLPGATGSFFNPLAIF